MEKIPFRSAECPRRTLSKVEGEALRKNAFVFVATTFGLRFGLRQQGMKICIRLPRVPRSGPPRRTGLAPPWATLMPCRNLRGTLMPQPSAIR